MTKYESYEDQLFQENIIIKERSLPKEIEAMCFKYDSKIDFADLIVIDDNKFDTTIDKCGAVMHEEMHLKHPETMYNFNDPLKIIKAKEKKVERLIARNYVPQQKLFDLIYKNKLQLYEIAEELCIPESIIKSAYEYYSSLESWINKLKTIALE